MKTNGLLISALAVIAVCAAFFVVSDDSDGSYATSYGSPDVGACTVVFDTGSGTGGYMQYVISGNEIYLPTQYKASGTSDGSYTQITRDGYVLTGWKNGDTVYSPGQSYTVTGDQTFTAVWKETTYDAVEKYSSSSIDDTSTLTHVVTTVGTSYSESKSYKDMGNFGLFVETSGSNHTWSLKVTYNGNDYTSSVKSQTGASLNAQWVNVEISSNRQNVTLTGTPDRAGVFIVELNFSTTTTSLYRYWVFSVADTNTDPSDLKHVTYGTGYHVYGPSGTSVKLPSAYTQKQKGWIIDVDGSAATFPVGGSYTLVKDLTLVPSEYTASEVIASGVVGVIAYNANGGTYKGDFAELVPSDGYQGLKDGSIVTKSGYTFLGWNATGLSSDPIYPVGYLYPMQGAYTELKAVWGTPSGSAAKVSFVNPGNHTQDISYTVYAGYSYALPVSGFELSGYDFRGWSSVQYAVGQGTADSGKSVAVTGDVTYYAVFKEKSYACKITFYANNGTDAYGNKSEIVKSVPYRMELPGCPFTYSGYTFLGWSENRYADGPSFSAGGYYEFTDSADVVLYAVWTETVSPEYNLFYVVYMGNGSNVDNVPAQSYRTSTLGETVFYVPSQVPMRDGYDFRGWALSETGTAQYQPNGKIVLTLDEGQSRIILTLYAVWEKKASGDGTEAVVTFQTDSGITSEKVATGNTVTQPVAPVMEGRAFLGWYFGDTAWDFTQPVTQSMTLIAKYKPIFHLDIDGTSVKVVLDCVSSSTVVSFSDGFTGTYTVNQIPAREVEADSSGTVTVSVVTEDGKFSSSYRYDIGSQDPGKDSGNEVTEKKFDTTKVVVGGIVGLLALIVVARRFI